MGFGKRIRITRPPPGKKEWEDKTATVVTLVPKAKHPLHYTIRFDEDGSEHNVAADCLEPLKIEEEIEDGPFGYCIVNDLMYCQEHRLEVCGSCGVDHRMTNYQIEITCSDDFEVVDRLMEGMQCIGAPSRRAPTKKSKKKSPMANTAIFRPVVNDHLVMIQDGFNPSTCDPWPSGASIEIATRNANAYGLAECFVPEEAKIPLSRVRDNVVCAAHLWCRFLQMRSQEPMMRLHIQDEAQTQALSLDLVLPCRVLRVGERMVPVFVVRWARALATNHLRAFAVVGTMERNTRMSEVPARVDEIELMEALLRRNGEKLDKAFVRAVEKHPDILSVSVLTPITEAAQHAFYESLGGHCHQCGTSGVYVSKCSRCNRATYCSRECQKKNWKFHKSSCRSP